MFVCVFLQMIDQIQGGIRCPGFILVYESTIAYSQYSLSVRWTSTEGNPVWALADVDYTVLLSYFVIFLILILAVKGQFDIYEDVFGNSRFLFGSGSGSIVLPFAYFAWRESEC